MGYVPISVESWYGDAIRATIYVQYLSSWIPVLFVVGPDVDPSFAQPTYIIGGFHNLISRDWASFGGRRIDTVVYMVGKDRRSIRDIIMKFLHDEGVRGELITLDLQE